MSFWDFLFAKAVVDTAKEVKKEVEAEKIRKNIENQQIAYGNSDSEKIFNFVRKINKTIPPYKYKYQFDIDSELSTKYADSCGDSGELNERQNILYQLKSNPNSVPLNIKMIENLIGLLNSNYFYDEDGTDALYFIEECRYYIDKTLSRAHTLPSGIGNKYLLLSIDAELYMMQGNFVCALKRYFEILSWTQMITNAYKDSCDSDLTEELYGFVVSNIMSILKILGLRQNANDISSLFHKVLQYHRRFNQESIKDEYTQARADTYFPHTDFSGFHVYNANLTNMSMLEWTLFPQFFTEYFVFNEYRLSDGGFCFVRGSAPICKKLIEAQKQPVLDLLNGSECESNFNVFDEKFKVSNSKEIMKEQDKTAIFGISGEMGKLLIDLYNKYPNTNRENDIYGMHCATLYAIKMVYDLVGTFNQQQLKGVEVIFETLYDQNDMGFTCYDFINRSPIAFNKIDDAIEMSKERIGYFWNIVFSLINNENKEQQDELLEKISVIFCGGIKSFIYNNQCEKSSIDRICDEFKENLYTHFQEFSQKETVKQEIKNTHTTDFSKAINDLFANNPHGLEPDSMVGDFLNSLCFVMAFNVDPDTGDIAEVLNIYFSYCGLDISVEQFMNLISENENLFEHYATSYQMAINLMLHRGIEINDTSLAMQCIDKAVELFTEIENIVIEKYPDIIYKKLASEVILDIVQTILDNNQ